MLEIRRKDPKIVAITAMPEGTGLKKLSERFPTDFSTWASPNSTP